MNIKVSIDVTNLTATSTDPTVVITEITEDSGVITLEVSKPDPEQPIPQPLQGV